MTSFTAVVICDQSITHFIRQHKSAESQRNRSWRQCLGARFQMCLYTETAVAVACCSCSWSTTALMTGVSHSQLVDCYNSLSNLPSVPCIHPQEPSTSSGVRSTMTQVVQEMATTVAGRLALCPSTLYSLCRCSFDCTSFAGKYRDVCDVKVHSCGPWSVTICVYAEELFSSESHQSQVSKHITYTTGLRSQLHRLLFETVLNSLELNFVHEIKNILWCVVMPSVMAALWTDRSSGFFWHQIHVCGSDSSLQRRFRSGDILLHSGDIPCFFFWGGGLQRYFWLATHFWPNFINVGHHETFGNV